MASSSVADSSSCSNDVNCNETGGLSTRRRQLRDDHGLQRVLLADRPVAAVVQEEPPVASPRMAEVRQRRAVSTGRFVADRAQQRILQRTRDRETKDRLRVEHDSLQGCSHTDAAEHEAVPTFSERVQKYKNKKKHQGVNYESLTTRQTTGTDSECIRQTVQEYVPPAPACVDAEQLERKLEPSEATFPASTTASASTLGSRSVQSYRSRLARGANRLRSQHKPRSSKRSEQDVTSTVDDQEVVLSGNQYLTGRKAPDFSVEETEAYRNGPTSNPMSLTASKAEDLELSPSPNTEHGDRNQKSKSNISIKVDLISERDQSTVDQASTGAGLKSPTQLNGNELSPSLNSTSWWQPDRNVFADKIDTKQDLKEGAKGMFDVGSWTVSDTSFQSVDALPTPESQDPIPPSEVLHPSGSSIPEVVSGSSLGNESGVGLNPLTADIASKVQIKSLLPPPPPPGTKKKKRTKKKARTKVVPNVPVVPEGDESASSETEKYNQRQGKIRDNPQPLSDEAKWETRKPGSILVDVDGAELNDSGVLDDSCILPEVAVSDHSSPASISAVLQDLRLAEKVDRAISAAAEKFEAASKNNSLSQPSTGAFSRDKSLDISSGDMSHLGASESVEANNVEYQPKNLHIFPDFHPSPFEAVVFLKPKVISQILDFLGDPVAVTRFKSLNRVCKNFIEENEYKVMKDAVRLGGMRMNVRPYFWMWVTLQKLTEENDAGLSGPVHRGSYSVSDLKELEALGLEGKWHGVIERDVTRSFGNLPPHKTGARLRTDSIIRALVTWGRSRFLQRGIKGSGDPPPPTKSFSFDDSEATPTDTVSDWGGVTPAGSFASEFDEEKKSVDNERTRMKRKGRRSPEEMALSANILTDEAKESLQSKLSFILHCLSVAHEGVGYCQGMDYVVAHLLRILQDTIRWKTVNGSMPTSIRSTPSFSGGRNMSHEELKRAYAEIDNSMVVEETCFRVMDTFMSTYDLRHFYWPELRCLKTCCRVFEKLIQIKLPVLAEHMEYHELNVGLFALGWFQTLFLYLPSMPSATVCHMWDIWIVERSFKIFFRVATAILFLSQPILLNHELEGMMGYLNTFPDATLLSPDILIACALQIKITNRMLMDLENEVVKEMMV